MSHGRERGAGALARVFRWGRLSGQPRRGTPPSSRRASGRTSTSLTTGPEAAWAVTSLCICLGEARNRHDGDDACSPRRTWAAQETRAEGIDMSLGPVQLGVLAIPLRDAVVRAEADTAAR